MRVALVCGQDDPARDGVADYVHRLSAALGEHGVEASVVPAVPRALGMARAVRRLARWRPDVVHVQFSPSAYGWSPAIGLLPLLAPRQRPLLTTLHEYGWWSWPPRVPERAWRRLESTGRWDRETLALGPLSSGLIVTNHRHAETVRGRLGREPLVVPIGPNVPDAGLSRAAARSAVADRHGVPPQARLLVFFGFVHPVKGVRYLVEALPALRARFGDVRAVVAGGFTSLALPAAEAAAYRAELEDRARTCGVADCVTFTGHLPAGEVSALLRAADAVVLPYTAGVTTKSGALLAAFDHGVPVVATTGDPPDPEIVDGTAVVAAPRVRDAGAVEAAVGRLLADPRLAARVASGGRAVARTRSWPVIAARHGELYRSVAAGGQ